MINRLTMAAARRRCHSRVVALDRLELANLIALEILLGENAALIRARLDDRVGDRALIEGVVPFSAMLEANGKIGLDQPVTAAKRACRPASEDGGGRPDPWREPLGLAVERLDVTLSSTKPLGARA